MQYVTYTVDLDPHMAQVLTEIHRKKKKRRRTQEIDCILTNQHTAKSKKVQHYAFSGNLENT